MSTAVFAGHNVKTESRSGGFRSSAVAVVAFLFLVLFFVITWVVRNAFQEIPLAFLTRGVPLVAIALLAFAIDLILFIPGLIVGLVTDRYPSCCLFLISRQTTLPYCRKYGHSMINKRAN